MEDVIDSDFQTMQADLQRFAGISSSIASLVFVALCVWLIIRVVNRRE